MAVEVLEVYSDSLLVSTVEGTNQIVINQDLPIQTFEIGMVGPQGPQGVPGPGAFPSLDAGNVLTFGTDQGLYSPPQMVWASAAW